MAIEVSIETLTPREQVLRSIGEVEKKGFGEVRVVIQNGYIHRIVVTQDKLLIK